MKSPIVTATALLVSSSISLAAPTVTDNTISWPNDGWYQVQSAETYDSICGGTTSCEVEPGVYNVINHSTGERFENIQVGAADAGDGPITVSGNTISWPDNGWYQVQRASDYFSLCGGGTSCEVPNGVYTVINHSTGERFNNVQVTGGSGLNSFGSSDAFYSALRSALINSRFKNKFSDEVDFEDIDAPVEAIAVEPAADADSLAGAAPASRDVTSTTVQEVGVDEQDRVKVSSDGTELFVLDTSYEQNFVPLPMPIDFEVPVDEIDIEQVDPVEPTDVDPLPEPEIAQLSIAPPRTPTTTLRILALDPETPDANEINEITVDLKGRDADGLYLYENGDDTRAIVTASGGGYWGIWNDSEAFSGRSSIIANVDVSDSADAALASTFTLDGQIISSRRIGDSLFFASRYYPQIRFNDRPAISSQEQWQEAVEATDLEALMPRFSRDGSEDTAQLVNARACFVATGVADQPYYSPDIITLGMIDLKTMTLQDSQCYLGATETLYANQDAVYLATTRYDYQLGPVTTDGMLVDTTVNVFEPDLIWSDPRSTTDLHRFDIKEDKLSYAGSGSVPGHLGWNQFQKPYRMSEKDGYLRIATMNDRQGKEHSPILFNVLKGDGKGNLQTVGSLPNKQRPEFIGKPGERLYASRFVGDRAYLVTFRQTDPLYLLDLSNPVDPKVTGELEIEGYSDYLVPVDETHLLGIGKDAIALGGLGDGRGGFVQGIKLALFDVSDASAPTEVQSLVLGERGTDSIALYNPRALTIQAANDNHPMRVSFGASVHGNATPDTRPTPDTARRYTNWSYIGLHGYDVTGGANASITPRGALIVDKNDGNRYGGNYREDRSVMVDDAVFYVNGTDVYPALWDNLANTPEPR